MTYNVFGGTYSIINLLLINTCWIRANPVSFIRGEGGGTTECLMQCYFERA